MGCCDDRKNSCGIRTPAICVSYKGYLPKYSKLEENCLTTEETTDDIYHLIDWIKESVDLKDYDPDCLDIDKVEDIYFEDKERFLIKDVLKKLTEKVCALEDEHEVDDTLELDFKCLTSVCGDPITSLKDLLQTLIDEVCKLKNP